ncbi:DUF4365 domain-containing protein [Streptomyces venezuelae]|uniref:DUF4365 domain-containing protein n=1 Tax=Streptomyces venezuelae TaxID=54571 RepID=UPI003451C0BD
MPVAASARFVAHCQCGRLAYSQRKLAIGVGGSGMARVWRTRQVERAGVNAFRAVMESAGHIVQEIDGGNDYGEDCYLSFVHLGQRTGDIAAVQIKSGVKYRRASGYAIPCGNHFDDWVRSRIPVIGVVHDSEMRMLYWVNLTKFLREGLAEGKRPRAIPVPEAAMLDRVGIEVMVRDVRDFIAQDYGMSPHPLTFRSALSQALRKRRYEQERFFEDAPPGGRPIPHFVGEANFLERHPKFPEHVVNVGLYVLLLVVSAMMGPGLFETARSTYGVFSSTLWLLCFYVTFWFLVSVAKVDSNRRRAKWMRRGADFMLLSGWYFAVGAYLPTPPWPVPGVAQVIYASAVVGLVQAVLLYGGMHYVSEELSRRRRFRAVQRVLDIDEKGEGGTASTND